MNKILKNIFRRLHPMKKYEEIIIESSNKKISIHIDKKYSEDLNKKLEILNEINFTSPENRLEILFSVVEFLKSLKVYDEELLKVIEDDDCRNTILKNLEVVKNTVKIHEDNIKKMSS